MSSGHEGADGKKLKQARLPFQRVNPETISSPAEKRKATEEGQLKRKREKPQPKVLKENVTNEVIDLNEDSRDSVKEISIEDEKKSVKVKKEEDAKETKQNVEDEKKSITQLSAEIKDVDEKKGSKDALTESKQKVDEKESIQEASESKQEVNEEAAAKEASTESKQEVNDNEGAKEASTECTQDVEEKGAKDASECKQGVEEVNCSKEPSTECKQGVEEEGAKEHSELKQDSLDDKKGVEEPVTKNKQSKDSKKETKERSVEDKKNDGHKKSVKESSTENKQNNEDDVKSNKESPTQNKKSNEEKEGSKELSTECKQSNDEKKCTEEPFIESKKGKGEDNSVKEPTKESNESGKSPSLRTARKSLITKRLSQFQFQKTESPKEEKSIKEENPSKLSEDTEEEKPSQEELSKKCIEVSETVNEKKGASNSKSSERSPSTAVKINKRKCVSSPKHSERPVRKATDSEHSKEVSLEASSTSKSEVSPIPNKKSRKSEKESPSRRREGSDEALPPKNVERKEDGKNDSFNEIDKDLPSEDDKIENKDQGEDVEIKEDEDVEMLELSPPEDVVPTTSDQKEDQEMDDVGEKSEETQKNQTNKPNKSKVSLFDTKKSPDTTSKEDEHTDTEMEEVEEDTKACDSNKEVEECTTPTSVKNQPKRRSKTPASVEKLSAQEEGKTRKSTTPGAGQKRISKVLTPSQLKKQKEKELKEQERLKAKEEKERLKKEKEKAKKEKMEQKEREKQEKEKERLEKEKEKQEKLKKKQEELDKKAEIKKKREDERKQQEEEKKKQEEEKKKQEEEKRQKEEKSKAVFRNFFNVKKSDATKEEKDKQHGTFKPFEVQENTQIAPARRASCGEDKVRSLDSDMDNQAMPEEELYLKTLKKNPCVRKTSRTWRRKEDDDDIQVIEYGDSKNIIMDDPSTRQMYRWKLLQFKENVRPAYWGTWRQKSTKVKPRNPFNKDETLLNYEEDSGDEWEEEPEGEDLAGSEEEKESDDEYEVDNDLFVPHGYLSEDEDNEEEQLSPEAQRERLKLKALEFDKERKSKTSTLKPRLIECKWQNDVKIVPDVLLRYSAIFLCKAPIATTFSVQPVKKQESPVSENGTKNKGFPEEAIPSFLRLIHCNYRSRFLLNEEFKVWWAKNGPEITNVSTRHHIPKRQINIKIHELATFMRCPDPGPLHNRKCWYVSAEVRKRYNLDESSLPFQWVYISERIKSQNAAAKPMEKSPKTDNSITRFTTPTSKLVASPSTPKASTEGPSDPSTPLSRTPNPDSSITRFPTITSKLARFAASSPAAIKASSEGTSNSGAPPSQVDSSDPKIDLNASGQQRGSKRRNGSPGIQQQQPPKKRVPITTLTTFLGSRKPRETKVEPKPLVEKKAEPEVITLD